MGGGRVGRIRDCAFAGVIVVVVVVVVAVAAVVVVVVVVVLAAVVAVSRCINDRIRGASSTATHGIIRIRGEIRIRDV